MSTVQLVDTRETVETTLPKTGGVVVLYTSLLFGDVDGVNAEDELGAGKHMLLKLIKSWNFVDAEDKPLEVTEDALALLPMEDMNHLIETMSDFMAKHEANKKK